VSNEKKKGEPGGLPFFRLGCFRGSGLNTETTEAKHREQREKAAGLEHKSLHGDGIVGVAGDVPAWVLAGVRE